MDHTLTDIKDAIFFIEKDGKPMKVAEVKGVEFNFKFESKHSVEIPQKTSFSFESELPDIVKELMGMGFTPQQAWNIHFRQRSKWKALQEELTNELDMMQLLDKVIGRVEELECLLEEIKCYEAYCWGNDRNFIDARIKQAFS
ncbi:hypothetical protein P9W99_26725 [Bacillus cereus]|uniref:Uncharacterized protein n=1 Tax=Bacillus cereus ISP2954 TaxID=1053215 RepID=A0A9W5VHQ7_BACCE|nr:MULTISPECIES: hypothetical protein [Bacillus cereus group]QCW20870.1 hypothetical protein WG69_0054 [Bacillus phage vB_BthS-TP21T]AGE75983.1 hypothetical protein HD73_0403 [Bacillus thuringiensis serovar kurstaki str. HD73]AIE31560.1 hypothetical protein BTK_02160 [Bacillus thuringiensis serovar kurstaki str. HD-1]AJK43434.1 hypothetical protein BG08_5634 [Bacillus thuringiensis serovar kurstaki]AKJ59018.1 hypothetical protein XI92_12195 [Bacillus thuringiensis]